MPHVFHTCSHIIVNDGPPPPPAQPPYSTQHLCCVYGRPAVPSVALPMLFLGQLPSSASYATPWRTTCHNCNDVTDETVQLPCRHIATSHRASRPLLGGCGGQRLPVQGGRVHLYHLGLQGSCMSTILRYFVMVPVPVFAYCLSSRRTRHHQLVQGL